MSTAEIAIAALAAAIGTAGAVTALGTSKPVGPGPAPTPAPAPAPAPTPAPAPAPTPAPVLPQPPAVDRLADVNARRNALVLANKNPFARGTNPLGPPTRLAANLRAPGPPPGPPGLPPPRIGDPKLVKRDGGRRRVSTLRRKPKTRSKNGRRSPRKSTIRRYR